MEVFSELLPKVYAKPSWFFLNSTFDIGHIDSVVPVTQSKRRGLSLEEKRSRMMELLYEKKDFFQLKDLERMAPKEKGITAQSVKEVVQSLVDDSLVDTDKIGTSIYFWAFPSKATHNRQRKLQAASQGLTDVKTRTQSVVARLTDAKIGKENSEERTKALADVASATAVVKQLESELAKYKESDPEVLEQQKREAASALEAANRWTDNIFAVRSWAKNKFTIDTSVLDKQFSIPAEFDYVE